MFNGQSCFIRSFAVPALLVMLTISPVFAQDRGISGTAEAGGGGDPQRGPGGKPKAGEVRDFDGGAFAWIPAGKFDMGDKMDAGRIAQAYGGLAEDYGDAPRHGVTISSGFWLAVNEVTNAEFEAFVNATNYRTEAESAGTGWTYDVAAGNWKETASVTWRNPGWSIEPKQPVVLVSWNDAQAYINWLNGKAQDGGRYALPTEAQWEYACRAGSKGEFTWGDDANAGKGHLNGADETPWPGDPNHAWQSKFGFNDGHFYPSPVGSFKPNDWGLRDMLGNAGEWCQDWYGAYPSDSAKDPQGPGSGQDRVIRGGSWVNLPGFCRSACRYHLAPGTRSFAIGFRLLRN